MDGSQIYAVYKPGAYDSHEEFNKDLTSDADILKKIQQNYTNYGIAAHFRYVGPRGDRGGGLQDNAASEGENTPYWLDYNAGKTDGRIQVKLVSPDEFFDYMDRYRNSKYKVWNSELPMRTHGVGSYTSWGLLKRWNRKNELLADAAEKASSLSYWLGTADYPADALRDAWIRTIWQQHHDGITGTSTLKANEYSYNEYYLANRTFAQQLMNAAGAASQVLDTQTEGIPMVVYNPLSHERTDIVEGSLSYPRRVYDMRVIGPDGAEVLSQITGYDEQTGQLRFIFAATVPSLGYAVYDIRPGEQSRLSSSLVADEGARQLFNGRYRVTINANGDMEPCAFIHYSTANIKEQTLLECYQSPLFMAYRRNQPFNENMLRPCPVLDNPGRLTEMVEESGAYSTDLASPERACDYCNRCVPAAERWAPVADELWENTPNKRGTLYTGKMAKKN